MAKNKWLYPMAAERAYRQALIELAHNVNDEIERIITRRYDSEDGENWRMAWLVELAQLPKQFKFSFEKAALALKAVINRVNRFNHQQFQKVFSHESGGLHIAKKEDRLPEIVRDFIQENVDLIKSIPQQQSEKVAQIIRQAVQNQTPETELIKQIKKAGKITLNRAELIAQDQVGKLNSQLTHMRQENVGIKQYRWRGTLDKRERDSHLRREGKLFSWNDLPSDGHPGQPIRCRCWAQMVLPELAELDGALFGAGGDNRRYQAEMRRRGLQPEADMPDLADDIHKAFGFL